MRCCGVGVGGVVYGPPPWGRGGLLLWPRVGEGGVWLLLHALEGACAERDFTCGGGVWLLMRALVFVLAQVHYF